MHEKEPDRSCFVIYVYYYIPVNSLSRKDKLKIRCNAHWKFSASSVLVLRFHDIWRLIVHKRHVLSCEKPFRVVCQEQNANLQDRDCLKYQCLTSD